MIGRRYIWYFLLVLVAQSGQWHSTARAQCASCLSDEALEDGGALCEQAGFEVLADLQAQLLLSCPLSLFPLGMDSCCRALLEYDWWLVQSCLCSGKTGLAGLIVSPKNIIESCGCVAIDRASSAPPTDVPRAENSMSVSSGKLPAAGLASAGFTPL